MDPAQAPPPPRHPPGANARGVALQLVRCWELVDHLRGAENTAPDEAEGLRGQLHGALAHQMYAASERFARAAKREGSCAIVTGCGRLHDEAAAVSSAGYWPLHMALVELARTWQTTPPASCPEAAADLAALLRQYAALHREVAPALCAVCRPAFLAHLEALA